MIGSPGNYWLEVAGRGARNRATVALVITLSLIIVVVLLAPWLPLQDPNQVNSLQRLAPIGTSGHILGTDEIGRDMLSRLVFGGRSTLLLGVTPVLVAFVIGGSLGLVAGYLGGFVSMMIMRTMDVFYAFPSVLLAIGLSGALGAGPGNLVIAVSIVLVPQIARVSESVSNQMRSMGYIEAARASGAGTFLILRYHVLRNVLAPVIVFSTSLISVSLIISAGLNFLGFGVQPPIADWGLMLNTLRQAIWINPGVAVLPGAAIFLTSYCFSKLSDGLRAALNIKE